MQLFKNFGTMMKSSKRKIKVCEDEGESSQAVDLTTEEKVCEVDDDELQVTFGKNQYLKKVFFQFNFLHIILFSTIVDKDTVWENFQRTGDKIANLVL